MKSLQKKIDTIFDHLYAASSIKNTETIAYEFSKILHTGIYIEKIQEFKPAFSNFALYDRNSMFNNTEDVLAIREQYKKMNSEWRLFSKDNAIKFSDDDISYICHEFHDVLISDDSTDIVGDSLEVFRNYSVKSLGGQFFTDSNVTKLALNIIDYKPQQGEVICDICAGTGGFLLAAVNKARKETEVDGIATPLFEKIVRNQICGKEIDETVKEAANRNLYSSTGFSGEFITQADSLQLKDSENNKYDCLATNPPFGTKTTIEDSSILESFELSHKNNSKTTTPTPPDILFLEKNINLLKPETGRLAIVLPYQILSGPKTSYIRRWVLERCIVLSVIDLPAETFQPHTGTKTCLLVLKKKKKANIEIENDDYTVFMAKPKWVGHDRRGITVYKKNPDGSDSTEILCDFDDIYAAWNKYVSNQEIDNDNCKVIHISQIISDKSLRLNALVHIDADTNESIKDGKPLSSLVTRIFYPGRFKRNYVEQDINSVPFLGGSNITEHIVSTKKYISKKDPHLSQLIVKEGWILITRSGTTGIVSMVPKEWDGYAISEHVIRIVPDKAKEDPNFLYAFLQSDSAKKQLSKQVFGSVIDEISPEAVGNLVVPNVPQETKKKVSNAIENYNRFRNESIVDFNSAVMLLQRSL